MTKKVFLLAASLMAMPLLKAQTAFSENFQNATSGGTTTQFPSGWTTYSDNKTNDGFAAMGQSWCISEVESGNIAAASVSKTTQGGDVDRWMVTPSINIPSANYTLQFRAFSADLDGVERLRVMVSTTGVEKADFTTTVRDLVFDGSQDVSGGWNNVSLPLADFAGQNIHIAFVNHGNGYFVFVDDIEVAPAGSQNLHMALTEVFTSQYCGNCPEGEEALEGAYAGLENRVAYVFHHAGYQDDAYTIQASKQLESLYNANTYAPAWMIDRSMAYADGQPGPVHYIGSDVMMHQTLSRVTSVADNIVLGFTNIDYNAGTRQLSLSLEGYFIQSQNIEAPRVTVYLVEDSLIAFQQGDDNIPNYRHDHVVRACLTDAWGDADIITSTAANARFSKTFTYTLPAGLRANKCHLVAFVNNYGADAVYGREVYNTTKSGYITNDRGGQLGIEDLQATLRVKTYPNPATDRAYITTGATIRSLSLLSVDGRTAMQLPSVDADMVELDLSPVASGLYIVRLLTDQGPVSGKLIVK
ncbi:MAG: Omp28-related outer membrane protein [Bacteroidales bacterium]|nr:Omp28-related outer membrane protein [Bacteroidales bacterium]